MARVVLRGATSAAGNGERGKGIVGPGMLGIFDAEVFADLKVGGRPEASQVAGDLDGAIVGAEEVHENLHAATGDAGGVKPAKNFLKTDSEDGGSA
jgi:hypothetical protein